MFSATRSLVAIVLVTTLASCSTAPKASDRASFLLAAKDVRAEFVEKIPGLEEQIAESAGVIIFPGIGEWGSLFGGGRFGRATFERPDGELLGWAALQSGSLGLGGGLRRFQMLLVLRDEATVRRFMEERLSGDVETAVVLGQIGGSTSAAFDNGVAVYQTAGEGLLIGARFNLDLLRYESLESAPAQP